uniref:non-specific serine/threonine protein kinase n=1 Tax=Oryza barthii TaxID=65489 RepID=A0A0D3EVP4_9ORYZ
MDGRSILMGRYEVGKQLGQGTFAKVYYARNLTTGQAVAIKMINKDKVMKVGLMEQIKREISIMRLVKHPNVLQLFEVMASKSKIYFVLEYAKGGELFNKIAKEGKLSEDSARRYFHQLINAVDYCHSRGVYHRDLKPENLLLDENENLKVSDFGLSALAESKRQDGLLHTTCGTPAYVAPEVLSRKGYDGAKADVWSCGVILFVLVAGYLPFHDPNLIEMYRKICRADFRCPRYFSAELKDLIHKILDSDPSTRISIPRIKRSTWYRKPVEINAKNSEAATTNSISSGVATTSGSAECSISEENQGSLSLPNLNAFDIISLSTGFNLSGFFEDTHGHQEERFTTRQPVTTVLGKLKELAKRLKLKVKKKDNGVLRLAALKEGKKGFLELDAEIFEVTPSFLLVELKKTNGDTMEYRKLVKEDIRPALKDIVWVWQGDEHLNSQSILQGEQQQSPLPPELPQDQLQPSLPQQEKQDMPEPPLLPQVPQEEPPDSVPSTGRDEEEGSSHHGNGSGAARENPENPLPDLTLAKS